jgi:hypothetical protein
MDSRTASSHPRRRTLPSQSSNPDAQVKVQAPPVQAARVAFELVQVSRLSHVFPHVETAPRSVSQSVASSSQLALVPAQATHAPSTQVSVSALQAERSVLVVGSTSHW